MNAGTAAYAAGDYGSAISHFALLLQNPDLDMQQRGYYNLANSLYRIGAATQEPAARQTLWSRALQHYGSALKLNPADVDAAFNQRFLTGKLEALHRQNPTAPAADTSTQPPDDPNQKPASEKPAPENKSQKNPEEKHPERPQPDTRPGEKPDENSQEPKPPRKTTPQPGDGLPGAASDDPNPGNRAESSGTPTATAGDQNLSPDPMTLEQAMRLLDSQKEDQKTIRLLPRGTTKSKHRKDW